MGIKSIIVAGGILGSLAACTENPNDTKWQYFPDMADSPAFKTQGNYLNPPEGSISRTAILYPETRAEAAKVFQNPFKGQPGEDKHLKEGHRLFGIFCTPCHGAAAKGDGSITHKFPRPPDLAFDIYKQKTDGEIFDIITHGGAMMPSYGHAISPHERWEIILALREFQNAPPPAPAASAEPAKDTGTAQPKEGETK